MQCVGLWEASLRSRPLYADLSQDQYTQVLNGIVTKMHSSPWSQTIAHPQGYPDEIAGFVLHRHSDQGKPVIGYLFVKAPCRRQGVARILLEHGAAKTDFLAVQAQPRVLTMARDRGLKPQLSPYLL